VKEKLSSGWPLAVVAMLHFATSVVELLFILIRCIAATQDHKADHAQQEGQQ